jgi:hypothetical protein
MTSLQVMLVPASATRWVLHAWDVGRGPPGSPVLDDVVHGSLGYCRQAFIEPGDGKVSGGAKTAR